MADHEMTEMNGDLPPADPEATELEALQLNINRTTDDSLESTRRMISMCEASKEAGIQTLVMLDEQGEQLENFEEGMDEIGRDMKEAEDALGDMEKCCGLCVLPWKKAKDPMKDPKFKDTWNKTDDGDADGPRMVVGGDQVLMSGNYVTKITNDAREDEMENNIVEVSGMIGNLRNMAIDMGNEIGSQNQVLDRINTKAGINEVRIQEANKRANKLL